MGWLGSSAYLVLAWLVSAGFLSLFGQLVCQLVAGLLDGVPYLCSSFFQQASQMCSQGVDWLKQ